MNLKELKEQEQNFFEENSILITCFNFKVDDKEAFRMYWKDINNSYLYNPMVTNENSKRRYPFYYDYTVGLNEMIESIKRYLYENERV